jgi:peptidoglycan/xylan/chitin deacetylase (PgdA/CDA1 family)
MRVAIAFGLVVSAAAAFGGVWAYKTMGTAPAGAGSATALVPPALTPSGAALASVNTTPGQSPAPARPVAAPVSTLAPVAAPAAIPAPVVVAQAPAPAATRSAAAVPPAATPSAAPPSVPAARTPPPPCNNPKAMGVARTVEIDTTGGPGFGFEHFKNYDFLRENEVVLTFDDGPWLNNTPMVLKALAEECVRATFFAIGKHATYYPDILKQVGAGGHSIGSHTWSHQDLSKKTFEEAKQEIEMGMSAVRMSLGAPAAPFFRFPSLKHPPELVTYLGERNVGIFSTDFDSFDFKMRKPDQVIAAVLAKLKKHGKGIALMHDFQQATAHAVPEMLKQLKANGYKIVHMRPKDSLATLAQYDELVLKEQKLPTMAGGRPTASVVRDVTE